MLFVTAQHFFSEAAGQKRLDRQEEIACAARMRAGDADARAALTQSYLPFVAASVKRVSTGEPSLELICRFVCTLEREVEAFDFSQESEPFTHRLSLALKKTTAEYIADQ